jgi:hypothetical protein
VKPTSMKNWRDVVALAEELAGSVCGEDDGWVLSLVYPVLIEFDQSVPALDPSKPPQVKSMGG